MRSDTVAISRVLAIDYLAMLNHRIAKIQKLPPTYVNEPRLHDLRSRMRAVEDALGVTYQELVDAIGRSRREASHA